MVNKDFLKEVFKEEKSLMPLDRVKRISVPLYDELSVISLWPMMKDDAEFMKYFPSQLAKGRVPDREYFFNILNTLQPAYIQALVKHANDQRNSAAADARAI